MNNEDLPFLLTWKKGMKKVFIQMCIIFTLYVEKECTGYFITEEIRNRLGGEIFKISAGTVYPQLNKLEREGIVFSQIKFSKTSEIRPNEPRKFFELTEVGLEIVNIVQTYWIELVTTVNSFLLDIQSVKRRKKHV